MNSLRSMNYAALRLASLVCRPSLARCIHSSARTFRKPSICDVCFQPPHRKPCFDLRKVMWERGNECTAKLIRSFLYTQYWPREPSVVGLWMNLANPYLDTLSERYANTGDRFLAFEIMDRTLEKKLIGVLVAYQVYPWMVPELEEWAHHTRSKPAQYHMYFLAHCLKSADLFNKYNVPFIYNVEVLGTAAEVTGQGVATQLLLQALNNAKELRYPLVQVIATSQYVCKVCERCGMSRTWTMDYSEYVDPKGKSAFFPRRPHLSVSAYVKINPPHLGGEY